MNNAQAKSITDRLKGVFPNASHWQVKTYCEEWLRYVGSLNYDRAIRALDTAIKTCKYCPNIAEFNEIYNSTQFERGKNIKTDCQVCEGKGFKLFWKVEEKLPYQFIAYCDKCSAGINYKYEGNDGYVAPISFYADTQELTYHDNANADKSNVMQRLKQIAIQSQINYTEVSA